MCAASAVLALLIAGIWIRCGPIPAALLEGIDRPSTVIVDRQGRPLHETLQGGTRVQAVDADRLPPTLVTATLAAEDRRFYSHPGVDLVALVRAARHDLVEGRVVEGGSTITQQVAKLLLQRREGVHPRGAGTKLREMVLALRLEHRFRKQQILALYLNLASYGNQTAGAARASQLYFGVDAAMLTPAQAAFLASLPQRPSAFNPWKNPASSRSRQMAVLRRMAAAGVLDVERLREAREERLSLRPRSSAFSAPHFVEMVSALGRDGADKPARIETTLDLDLQREVEGIVEHERPALKAHGAANVAIVVLDNHRGEWLAWEGSGDYTDADHGGAINGPRVPRQPGSALKPFTYALAFEQGRTPATVLPDIPSHFPTAEAGVVYSPRNYDGQYRGPLLARRALAGSENVPAVALASDIGVSTLLRFLDRAGLTTFDRTPSFYGLGVTLGDAEVRLDELVAAYAIFARGGSWIRPTAILAPEPGHAEEHSVVSPRTAFWITDILSDPDARAFIFGRGSSLDFPFPVAVKTGTSQAYHDNWTIGYTRDVTVGVWVGNFDRTPLRDSSGVTGAGPIFHAVMLAAVRRADGLANTTPIAALPSDVEEATICMLSGMRATPWCPSRGREWVPVGAEAVPCSWHHQTDTGVLTYYPPEYRAWARSEAGAASSENSGLQDFAPRASLPATRSSLLQIANPPAGAIYSVDPTLRREFQALPLRAVTSRPTTVTWLVDGAAVGTAPSDRSLSWPLAVGSHQIEARDADGRSTKTSVIVK